jgi:hypothetical protein
MDTRKGLVCDERIGLILVRPGSGCDFATTADGFAHEPRKIAVKGLFWPSDHRGLQSTLACAPSVT